MIINRITPPNNNFFVSNIKRQAIYNTQPDTFVRTTPAFKGCEDNDKYSFEKFKKWSDENNFLSKANDIVEKTGKILGSGFEGTTYEIPDCENWIIKEYKRSHVLPVETKTANVEKFEKSLPKINAGQCIALVNIPCGRNTTRYYILQKQAGKPLGVKYSATNDIDDINIKKHLDMLSTLASASDKTYKQLIDDIKYVHSEGYELDVLNPQNFLFDKKENKINFVDINDKYRGDGTQYGEVLFALLDGYFGINFVKSGIHEIEIEEAKELSDIVIKKYFNALNKAGAKLTEGKVFGELLESSLLDDVLKSKDKVEKINKLKSLNLM